MPIKNTPENYGSVAKWLHWLTAALFLAAYMAVYYRHWFTEAQTPANWTALQLHLSFGVSIGVVVSLRVIWRVMNQAPEPEQGTKAEHFLAKLGHKALYRIMIALPITGYLGTSVDTEFFFLFDITKFEDTFLFQTLVTERFGISFKDFERPLDFIHKEVLGAWLAWILILGHAMAAIYHHRVKKDRTLIKMTTGA